MKLAHTALVVPALLLVAACGASNDALSASDPAPAARDAAGAPEIAPEAPADGKNLTDYSAGGATAPTGARADTPKNPTQTKAVISKGQVSVESEDLDKARFELKKLLDTWGGSIANEESSADDEGRTDLQQLELRVPSKLFGTAMDEISKLGKLVDRSRNSEDVTTQVIDINARVRSQKLSLARIEALMARAETLSQVISIESQLSQRQAELDSLEQQQKYLADQTAESTINVYLSLPDEEATEDGDDDANGFIAGLEDGWDAFRSTTSGVLQGLGAVLPFGVVLALLGAPAALAWRRRRSLS